jgi:hypothetical protein
MSPRGFISLALTTPSLTLTFILRFFASDWFALLWHPVFWDSTRIRKTCLVIAVYNHHGVDVKYDGLLFSQGMRAKSLKQPQRWVRYEQDEKSHSRYCTLLYGEGGEHAEWSILAAISVDSRSHRSFVENGKRSKWSVRSIGTSLPLPCGQGKEVLEGVEAYLTTSCKFWD